MIIGPKDPLDARNYIGRDWLVLEALKDQHWLARRRAMSATERINAAAELWSWAHQRRPDHSWESERESDLASHLRVSALLRRADGSRGR